MNHRNDQQGRQRGAQNERDDSRQSQPKMRQQEWREGQNDNESGRGNRNYQWSQRGGEEGYYRDGGEFQRGGNQQNYSGRGQGRNQGHNQGDYFAQAEQGRGGQYRGDEEYGRWNEGRYAAQGQGRERDDWQGMSPRGEEYAPHYPNRAGGRDWQGFDQHDYGQDRYAGYGYGSAPQAGQYNPSPEDDYRPRQYWGDRQPYGRTGRGPGGYAVEPQGVGGSRAYAQHSYGDSNYEQDQGHRGVGPKNYARSDERLREDINEKLTDAHWLDASELNVQAKDGKVTIEGAVSSRQLKHRVEDLVDRCYGVKDIDNRLTISNARGTNQGQSASVGNTDEDGGSGKRGKSQQH